GDSPPLFAIGCVGRIAEVEALDDGRFDIVLEGLARFTVVRELDVTTPFRQVEAALEQAGDIIEHMLAAVQDKKTSRSRSFSDTGLEEIGT
ncbi:LON peptidase substrate-binding domain-containing protein, partial [Enterobacter cloacae]|uniref:LON peptidase substrate-binding domain-containing protein n=1 Tax=Enterobacter cloacae TaxID=550 RepID=UPI0019548663